MTKPINLVIVHIFSLTAMQISKDNESTIGKKAH